MRTGPVVILLLALAGPAVYGAEGGGWYKNRQIGSQIEIGLGKVAGTASSEAAYISVATERSNFQASMMNNIPVKDFRGRRLSVTLRLKDEGEAQGRAGIVLTQKDLGATPIFGAPQANGPGDDWQSHRFVVDVPSSADTLILNVALKGKGRVWVDGIEIVEVGTDVPVTETFKGDMIRDSR